MRTSFSHVKLSEGLLDPSTTQEKIDDKGPVKKDEIEKWSTEKKLRDTVSGPDVEKFTTELTSMIGDREIDPDAIEMLHLKFPKTMDRLAYESSKRSGEELNEAEGSSGWIPKSFDEFRKLFAAALKKSGAPEDLVHEVGDVEYEGEGIAAVLEREWWAMNDEMKSNKADVQRDGFANYFEPSLYDTTIQIVDEYQNSMNYAPGRKVPQVDDVELANAVAHNWGGRKDVGEKTAGQRGKEFGEFSNMDSARKLAERVAEALRTEGAEGVTISQDPDPYEKDQVYTVSASSLGSDDPEEVANFLADEMRSHGSMRNYGHEFEEYKDEAVWMMTVDGDMSQLFVDLTDLWLNHEPKIKVANYKY
jgi:hypothetical protein